MTQMPPMLTYLAMVIDLREERLEKTTVPFLRNQIRAELDKLLERFQIEYQNYQKFAGEHDPAVLLKSA